MDEKHRLALRTRAVQLAYAALSHISWEGSVFGDLVSTHHILEVVFRLDPGLFRYYVELMSGWMESSDQRFKQPPFIVDSLTLVHRAAPELKDILEREILNFRLLDGSYVRYNAFLGRGDYFSTLWCVKILMNSGIEEFRESIRGTLEHLIERRAVAARDPGEHGFLLLLLARFDYAGHKDVADVIAAEIRGVLRARIAAPAEEIHQSFFLVEDLLEHYVHSGSQESLGDACDFMKVVLQLDGDPNQFPAPILKAFEQQEVPVRLETLSRAAISATILCRVLGERDLELDVNAQLLASLQREKTELAIFRSRYDGYLEIYESMHKKYEKYEAALRKIDQTHWPRERSIFIMMPFKKDDRYLNAAKAIKEECAKLGYMAFRIDEHERQFSETLWENLLLNMLSSKYAIALIVSEPVTGYKEKKETLQNPNVALEFGFFMSRGQRVLVLKDKDSVTPSDVGDFIWKEFDIALGDSVRQHVAEWVASLKAEEEQTILAPQSPQV